MEEKLEENVVETVETWTEEIGGETIVATMHRRKGLHWVTTITGERVLVDESATVDRGKLGVSLCLTPHVEHQPTEEELAEGRRLIQETAAQVLQRMGIW